MKKIVIIAFTFFIGATIALAQTSDNTAINDQTQEERNLEILSKKLVRMKRDMDKFVKDMSAAYQDQGYPAAGLFGSDVKVDIIENDKGFIVKADLPGMDKDKIDITLENGRMLKIAGARHVDKKETSPGVVKQERMEGRFERVLELPAECRSEGIGASYNNGVLEISIPKKEPKKTETVKVKVQ